MNKQAASEEKRRIQRIRLFAPMQAEVDGAKVMVVDISIGGARLEHAFALSVGGEVVFTVHAGQETLALRAEVVRCRLDRGVGRDAIVYHSGVSFLAPDEEPLKKLLDLIRELVNYDLEARNQYAGS